MEKFKQGQIVQRGDTLIIVTWGNGDHKNTFKGTVLQQGRGPYEVGEYSGTWHEDKFEIAKSGIEIKIVTP